MRRTPFSAIGPLDSDAMDTANAHNDTTDEASDILEQEPLAEATTEEQTTEEAGIDSTESPCGGALTMRTRPSASVISSSEMLDSATRSIKVFSLRKSMLLVPDE